MIICSKHDSYVSTKIQERQAKDECFDHLSFPVYSTFDNLDNSNNMYRELPNLPNNYL